MDCADGRIINIYWSFICCIHGPQSKSCNPCGMVPILHQILVSSESSLISQIRDMYHIQNFTSNHIKHTNIIAANIAGWWLNGEWVRTCQGVRVCSCVRVQLSGQGQLEECTWSSTRLVTPIQASPIVSTCPIQHEVLNLGASKLCSMVKIFIAKAATFIL